MVGQKNSTQPITKVQPNPIQSTWVGLNLWVWQIFYYYY